MLMGLCQPMVMVSCDDPKTAVLTKPMARPSPDNATFMECVEIDIRLPLDKAFAPSLEFYVYDNFQGLPFEFKGSYRDRLYMRLRELLLRGALTAAVLSMN